MWGRKRHVYHKIWVFSVSAAGSHSTSVAWGEKKWISGLKNLLSVAWRWCGAAYGAWIWHQENQGSAWSQIFFFVGPTAAPLEAVFRTRAYMRPAIDLSTCRESPSYSKNRQWNRHISSQRGQEGLAVPTSRDCEKFTCAHPSTMVHFTLTHMHTSFSHPSMLPCLFTGVKMNFNAKRRLCW